MRNGSKRITHNQRRAMIDEAEIEAYLVWKRDKELYPPQWTPAEYIQDVLNKDSRDRLGRLYDLLLNTDDITTEVLIEQIEEVVFK